MFTTRPEIRGTFGAVASTHWLASATGMAMLERGGNAFDAAVRAAAVAVHRTRRYDGFSQGGGRPVRQQADLRRSLPARTTHRSGRIVLEKFPEHWNAGAYHFKTTTFTGIPDATVRLANLRSGQLDLIERLAATTIPTVKGDPNLKVVPGTGLGYQGILYNIDRGDVAEGPYSSREREVQMS